MDNAFLDNGVTAHRGNSAAFPENTMSAFRAALACGADWIELDVLHTADGELVVCHDATTGRTANADVSIAETELADLRKLDMAAAFRTARGLDATRCPPERIPLLSEVLALVGAQRRTRVSIQPKSGMGGA